jgi:uncharacterized protein YbcI
MSGTITLETSRNNVDTSRKVKIERQDDTEAIRGITAEKVSAVFVDLKHKADFDLAIQALTTARECVQK